MHIYYSPRLNINILDSLVVAWGDEILHFVMILQKNQIARSFSTIKFLFLKQFPVEAGLIYKVITIKLSNINQIYY